MVRSKLSPSGDVMIQNVAFARRFVDVFIAATLVARSLHAGIAVTLRKSMSSRMIRFDQLVRI
jgi:hypothetical protein